MAATMSTLQSVLKNFYIGPIRENLNQATVLLAQLKKSSKEVVGEQVILPIHIGRNWGVGARGTNGTGTLPGFISGSNIANQRYNKAYFTTKDVYGRIQISGKTIRATKTDKGAFLRVVTSETQGMVKDLSSDINRQLFGNGTGKLAEYVAGSGTTTITVDSTQYLEEGMYIDFNYGAGGASTGIQIVSVDSATQITTLTNATAAGASDAISLAGVAATYELNGLDLITASTGILENIDPASFSIWKGNVFGSDAAPAVLTEYQMQTALDAAEKKGGKINFIVTSYEGRAKYVALLVDQKRFSSPQVGKLKGGYSYIDFNDVPLVVDRHCQANSSVSRMYFLSLDSLGIYRMADFEWAQEDGAVLARQVGSSAQEAYEGTLVCDMEFATTARRHNSVLKGIQL